MNNQFEYNGKHYFLGRVKDFDAIVIFELHEEDMDKIIDYFIMLEEDNDCDWAKQTAINLIEEFYKKENKND